MTKRGVDTKKDKNDLIKVTCLNEVLEAESKYQVI